MKKMLILGVLVISGISFGRDYEYRELQELKPVESVSYDREENISRERLISEKNIETYSEFHRELSNSHRGNEKR